MANTCECISGHGKFRFLFSSLDCKTFLFEDLSDWMEDDNYQIPSEYNVVVSVPAQNSPATVTIQTGVKNKLTSTDLNGVGGLCMNDGVYCFTLNSCGINHKIHKSISCRIDCIIDQIVAKISRQSDWDIITEAKNWMSSFHSNAEMGRIKAANDSYKIAEKLIRKIDCSYSGCC